MLSTSREQAALEQVEQADRPVRALEGVLRVEADHRQPAALGGEAVGRLHVLLLLDQQRVARGLPFLR
jgi:hypothetical protein